LKYAVVAAVGLTAGFSTRRFLIERTLLLQFLAAVFSAVLSLGFQYSLSGGFIGVQPFPGTPRYPDYDSLIQLGTASLAAALVILAFRRGRTDKAANPASVRVQEVPATPAGGPRAWLSNLRFPIPLKRGSQPDQGPITPQPPPAPRELTLAAPALKGKPTRKKRGKNSSLEIHFIGEEDHTCPYCLDMVEQGDSRGVKICPECKTWHHADCWGITGACQIPHAHGR
jgi:hypothetical protein